MSIYYEFIRRVESGETFYIDFEKRTMKVGKDFLIKNGEFDESKNLMDMVVDLHCIDDVIKHIEETYQFYKFSLPSERSDSKRKKYFKALSIDELDDEHLMCAGRREVEQARLEGFILCAILSGKFQWDDSLGKWFCQSKNDPDLVILRNWVENK
jgi:hypothetical protein